MPGKVGRFQVMATLQAARAKALGLPVATAKSWGLNKAIFYAAAKRGFRGAAGPARPTGKEFPKEQRSKVKASFGEFFLGDDKAYSVTVDGTRLFAMGGEVQTPDAFDRQIEQRFAGTFRQAWSEALALVKSYDREVLASGSRFYEAVYRPRRDELAKKWDERAKEAGAAATS